MGLDNKISTFKVPFEAKKKPEIRLGIYIVTIADDPCLTCGHFKRLQWMERVDGKKKKKEACLFCITTIHTHANREGL